MQGTFIGVLMSSTLPARLGEPSRALVVARRTGRPRENLPVVLGTLVSQTLLNIVALVVLGTVMFSSVDLFNGHQNALAGGGASRRSRCSPSCCWRRCCCAPAPTERGSRRLHAVTAQVRRGADSRAGRPERVPPAPARRGRHRRAAVRVGAAVAVLLRAAGRARARPPDGDRGRGRGPVRGQHHRGAAGHAGEPGRLPGRLRGRPAHRLARRLSAPASPTA